MIYIAPHSVLKDKLTIKTLKNGSYFKTPKNAIARTKKLRTLYEAIGRLVKERQSVLLLETITHVEVTGYPEDVITV